MATPANWKQGEDVILTGAVSDEEAKKLYPERLEDAEALHPRGAAAAVASRPSLCFDCGGAAESLGRALFACSFASGSDSMLVLYHTSHSTCSQKVRLVLHEKDVEFDEVRIDLAKKEQLKPDYLTLNPNGVVPTLVDDGVPIVESSVICEYLDEKYPQNPLVPSDIVERARMRAWMHYIEEVAVGAIRVPSFNRAFLYRFKGQDQKEFEAREIEPRPVRKELFQRHGLAQRFLER